MKTYDLEYARANLSRLVDEAASGEPFIVAKDGKPLVTFAPCDFFEPEVSPAPEV
ncbi:type II toxin-antitoxin system Phd/YefM family antitoxin [Brevundimonas sp.]|uniref:type II toxin-antitoxin system Phd/YefM family antitoxin n=1 Tax=Brevundimonas sp. TaxID=1871086 RepID=UPI001A2BE826|nr:type II toxin-antitoxin system Phd/YefM family antitoxin [Brevundimonas sp.]MBJ7486133.1 type II toxin-antitoxin system Phd/YefM family antitoxin [Brevundimonas sp.]